MPNGLPIARIWSPSFSLSESPQATVASGFGAWIFRTATSDFGSAPDQLGGELRAVVQRHLDFDGVVDDVVIGDDDPIGADDEAGAKRHGALTLLMLRGLSSGTVCPAVRRTGGIARPSAIARSLTSVAFIVVVTVTTAGLSASTIGAKEPPDASAPLIAAGAATALDALMAKGTTAVPAIRAAPIRAAVRCLERIIDMVKRSLAKSMHGGVMVPCRGTRASGETGANSFVFRMKPSICGGEYCQAEELSLESHMLRSSRIYKLNVHYRFIAKI